MKKILLLLTVVLFASTQGQAQKRLTRSGSKAIELGPKDEYTYTFDPHDVFEYGGKSYLIVSSVNMKLKLNLGFMAGLLGTASNGLVNYNGQTMGGSTFNSKTMLLELDPNVRGRRGIKKRKLAIPKKLIANTYQYIGFLQQGDMLNVYVGTENTKRNKAYVFCISHDLKTEATTTKKIFETEKKNDAISFFKSKKFGYAGFASSHRGTRRPSFNYLITTIDNQPVNHGTAVEIPDIKKATITDFLVGKNGELVFGAMYKERTSSSRKKQSINEVFILDRRFGYKQLTIPGKKYHSTRNLYMGIDDKIKTAYLQGDDENFYSELVMADLDLSSGRAVNLTSTSFKQLQLNDDTKKKTYKSKRKQKRKDKKETKNAQGGYHLTDVQVAPDGTTMLLMEQAYSVTRTRTSSNGASSSSTTYYYGPGKMILLDDQNQYRQTSSMTYKIPFSYDRGYGLDFLAMNSQNIVVKTSKYFTRYDLKKDKVRISRKGDSNRGFRNLVKAIKGQGDAFRKSDEKLYLIDIEHRTKVKLSTFDL